MNIENRIFPASETDKKPDVSGGKEAQEAGQKKTGEKTVMKRLKERARRRKRLILR